MAAENFRRPRSDDVESQRSCNVDIDGENCQGIPLTKRFKLVDYHDETISFLVEISDSAPSTQQDLNNLQYRWIKAQYLSVEELDLDDTYWASVMTDPDRGHGIPKKALYALFRALGRVPLPGRDEMWKFANKAVCMRLSVPDQTHRQD